MTRVGRRIPFKLAALVLVLCAPRCATKPSNCGDVTALHATFETTGSACGEFCDMKCDDGFIQCFTNSAGCETPDTIPTKHEAVILNEPGICSSNQGALEIVGNCAVVCAEGFFDCNDDSSDGCEHAGLCGTDASTDGGDAGAGTLLRTLNGAPGGLALCGDLIVYVDGLDIDSVNASTLAPKNVVHSPSKPVGGLACDDTLVYWTTPSDSDASPNGFVMSAVLQGSAPLELASGVDPAPGMDQHDGVVYFMTRSGLATVSAFDAGVTPDWMPASETGAYKPFATGKLGDFSIGGGAIHQRASDTSAPSIWLDDAGAASAIFTSAGGAPFAVFRDAGTSGDLVFRLIDDAGAPAMIAESTTTSFGRVVATTSGQDLAIVATSSAIYAVSTSLGIATLVATTSTPVVDVATDGAFVYFTTSSELRRAVIP